MCIRDRAAHVRAIGWRERQDGLLIDPMTFRHLEILEGAEGGRDGSLLSVLDRTQTVMGARRLRAWLMRPLTALERIQDRLDAVEEFAFKATERGRRAAPGRGRRAACRGAGRARWL